MKLELLLAALIVGAPVSAAADPTVVVAHETGPAYVAQNDGRYGDAGTPFAADEVGQQKNLLRTSRTSLELGWGRHTVIFLYAPFEVTTRVALAGDLQFRDTRFPAGTVVDHRYLFDGYRASYLFRLRPGALAVEVGASLQIRNADVAFTAVDGSLYDDQDDIGLVGAAKVRLRWASGDDRPWGAVEADALSTFGLVGDTSGALYDVAMILGVPVRRGVDLTFTARLLGGGAEVPSQAIDNWGNFVSATAGVRIELGALR